MSITRHVDPAHEESKVASLTNIESTPLTHSPTQGLNQEGNRQKSQIQEKTTNTETINILIVLFLYILNTVRRDSFFKYRKMERTSKTGV